MDVDGAAVGDAQRFRRDRLDAEIISARGDGALDLRAQQFLEHAEQDILEVDGERQQAVEEGGDRRQLFAQAAIAVRQLEAGGVLRSEEHTSELQSLMRISYAVFGL